MMRVQSTGSLCLYVRVQHLWILSRLWPQYHRAVGLALREVLEDEADVPQAVFERREGQDSGLVGWVQLEHRQQPPAPGWTVGRGLEDDRQNEE